MMINCLRFLPLMAITLGRGTLVVGVPRYPEDRIIGGEDASIESYPYQVSISVGGSHYCGGSIIGAEWVLTAGHCCQLSKSQYAIRAGSSRVDIGGSLHQVSKKLIHENYTTAISGVPLCDICLMKVTRKFVIDDTRRAIKFFGANEKVGEADPAVVTGWGTVSTPNVINPKKLQTVTVPLISREKCNQIYQDLTPIMEDQICALYQPGGKDSCQGDSGGPMAVRNRLVGIVSWGYGCATPIYPGVYTNVSFYQDWIHRSMKS